MRKGEGFSSVRLTPTVEVWVEPWYWTGLMEWVFCLRNLVRAQASVFTRISCCHSSFLHLCFEAGLGSIYHPSVHAADNGSIDAYLCLLTDDLSLCIYHICNVYLWFSLYYVGMIFCALNCDGHKYTVCEGKCTLLFSLIWILCVLYWQLWWIIRCIQLLSCSHLMALVEIVKNIFGTKS